MNIQIFTFALNAAITPLITKKETNFALVVCCTINGLLRLKLKIRRYGKTPQLLIPSELILTYEKERVNELSEYTTQVVLMTTPTRVHFY